MNVLEEFWDGNLDAAEYDFCTTMEYIQSYHIVTGIP